MEHQFKTYGIPPEDVTWITYPNKTDFIPDVCINDRLTKGQIACTYKHYLALKDIVENNHELAVILEDNIEFRGNVPSAIERYLNDLPQDWNAVFDSDFLGFKYIEGPIHSDCSVYLKSNQKSQQCHGSSKGAHFILLNLKTAKLLYDHFLPFDNVTDHYYNSLFRKLDMKVYWAEPPNVHKINRPSTWKDEPKKKGFSWVNANSSHLANKS